MKKSIGYFLAGAVLTAGFLYWQDRSHKQRKAKEKFNPDGSYNAEYRVVND